MLRPGPSAVASIVSWMVIGFSAIALFGFDAFGGNAKPDLGVIVIAAGSDMRPITAPGQPFSFRIALDNMNGTADAHHVKLSAILPNGLKFQSSEPPPTKVENGNHPVWEIDSLPAKALPRLFEVTAETDTNLAPGSQLQISAAAESSDSTANSASNQATYKIYVQKVGPALVFLDSTLDSVLLTAENPATFEIDIENAGTLPAIDARVEVTLPTGLKLDKADPEPAASSGQAVTFKLGDLAPAESKSVSMKVAFDSLQLPDLLEKNSPLTFAFRASRIASQPSTTQAAGSTPSSGEEVTDSHLEITKHFESPGYDVAVWLMRETGKESGDSSPNNDIACVIKFANLGNEAAHKVIVSLYLDPSLDITHSDLQASRTAKKEAHPRAPTPRPKQPGSSTQSDNGAEGKVVEWDIGDLDVGMSRTVHAVIHASSMPDEGAFVTAIITADDLDIDSTNNTASLLLRSPSPPSTLKSKQPLAGAKPAGSSEKPSLRPVSHGWRNFFGLILVVVAAVIFFTSTSKR
jgi:uncharacterized repeat protein (TIGR01451 family)